MTAPQSNSRRTSTNRRISSDDGEAALFLSRTRSQETSIVESIAVQEPPEQTSDDEYDDDSATKWPNSTRYLILLCAFITSLSFGVTQVPLLYVFRLMTCDAYYESHPSTGSPIGFDTADESILSYTLVSVSQTHGSKPVDGDRCSIHSIESSTALSISLLGASTTVFGLANLFLTGSLIKRIGVKPTLLIQVFFPALRLLVQNIGVEVWGTIGIIIIQCSQILTIIGGPSGYLLVLNTYITEVVGYEGRTAALGRLTGAMMYGSAAGFLLGGVVADAFGINFPFRLTLILFLSSCAYVAAFLPYIPPAEAKATDPNAREKSKKRVIDRVLGPLAVFAPRKFLLKDGTIKTELGSFLLAWGVFLGILATGYLPTLLQLYATDMFSFGTKANGWLIFMYSMLRGTFLTFVFPKLIAIGRRWNAMREKKARESQNQAEGERRPLLVASNGEAAEISKPRAQQTFTFDLTYTRFSLIADGLLTLLCSFVRQGWQMYLVAAVLPFAAGTGSAAKGTVLQMVGSSASSGERTDALAGVSVVENMARLSTTFVFGVIFAAFAAIGRTELVFTCNAAVALIGFCVLLFARFPPEGSQPLEKQISTPSTSSN